MSRRVFPAAALAAVREACCNRARLLRRCFPAHTPPAAFAPGLRCRRGLLVVCPLCAEGTGFLLLFHVKPKEGSSLFLRCSAALFPTCAPLFCRLYADFCACLSGLRCRCPPCALCAQFCFVSAVCLPVPCWLHARFSLISYLLPFPVWLLPRKLLFICRSCRDGPFLACPLPAALFPARGSCHLLLFRGLLRPLPVFPFCIVRAGFLFCFSPFPA